MLRKRIIPCLLLQDEFLVKTIKFKNPLYIGDPINAINIFNDKEVDEVILLDISCSKNNASIDFDTIKKVVSECFMPLTYGGGVTTLDQMEKIYNLGIEKIVINTNLLQDFKLLKTAARIFGSQSVVAGLDIKKNIFGKYRVYSHVEGKNKNLNFLDYCKHLEHSGAGELFLNSVDKDGTWTGFDLELNSLVSNALDIPVVASGGAGTKNHIIDLFNKTEVMAAALGSMAVYQKKDCGVLINFPLKEERRRILNASM